jgi:enoyl-CoA hydratase/carnithine racemase
VSAGEPPAGEHPGARSAEEPLVLTERDGAVALARLNRPEARNALSAELGADLLAHVEAWDSDPEVRCVVIAGNDEVFAAGGDIRALRERNVSDALAQPGGSTYWGGLAECRVPLVAAVSGYALGGGLELALLCDVVVAAEGSELGQPEIMLGLIPGGGGTQRLARAVGKQRAMELVLTGRRIDAAEAERIGIVNRVAPKRRWLDEALALARTVAERPPLAARLAKQAVLAAEETPLSAGLDHERRLFELALATEDRVEGMDAFLERRRPRFRGR